MRLDEKKEYLKECEELGRDYYTRNPHVKLNPALRRNGEGWVAFYKGWSNAKEEGNT